MVMSLGRANPRHMTIFPIDFGLSWSVNLSARRFILPSLMHPIKSVVAAVILALPPGRCIAHYIPKIDRAIQT